MLARLVRQLAIVVLSAAYLAAGDEGQLQSVAWSPCPLNPPFAIGGAYNTGFQYLDRCGSLSMFLPKVPVSAAGLAAATTANGTCFGSLMARVPQFVITNTTADCIGAASALLDGLWCSTGVGQATQFQATVALFVASVNPTARCNATAAAILAQAAAFVVLPPTQQSLRFQCLDGRVTIAACDRAAYATLTFPGFLSGQCDPARGIKMDCTACQPFFDRRVVTQPYLFLIFPGLKLVIMKLLELFVFFKVAESMRQRIERALRTQSPPPDRTHPHGFIIYVNRVLLMNGQRRIRQRMTSRHRDGKDNVLQLLDTYKKHLHDGFINPENMPGLEPDELKALVNDQGIVLQAASFRKIDCTKPCVTALEQCGLVANAADEDARDNEILDWFFNDVCAYGSRRLKTSPEADNRVSDAAELLACIKLQLDLMAKRAAVPLVGPRHPGLAAANTKGSRNDLVGTHEPIFVDEATVDDAHLRYRQVTDTVVEVNDRSGAIVSIDGRPVDAPGPSDQVLIEDDVSVAFSATVVAESGDCHRRHRHRVKHRKSKAKARLANTFLADAHEATEATTTHVVEVVLRSTVEVPGTDRVEEHLVTCNDTVTLLRVADTLAHALARQPTVAQSLRHVSVSLFLPGSASHSSLLGAAGSMDSFASFSAPNMAPPSIRDRLLDLSRHVRDVMPPDASRLCLRYSATIKSVDAGQSGGGGESLQHLAHLANSAEYEHCLDEYDAIDAQIDGAREAFEASCDTEEARFDDDWLVADTDRNLTRILDSRIGTIVQEFVLSLCGDEQIYECDVTSAERYELRDAIASLTVSAEENIKFIQTHSIDPLVTYYRCFEYLTLYKTWNGEQRHGVLKAFASERDAVLELLETLYASIRDRLLFENRTELDEVACRAMAMNFKPHLDDVSRVVPVVLIGEQVVKTIFAVNTYVLIVAVLYAIALFIVSCVDGATFASGNSDGWNVYEQIYFRFLNSGSAASIVCGSLCNWTINAEHRFQSKFFAVIDVLLLVVSIVLSLPPLVTHIIPGFAAYCWVLIGTVVILSIPVVVMRRLYMKMDARSQDTFADMTEDQRLHRRRQLKWALVVMFLLVSFISMVFMTGLFQSTFNWIYLLYRHEDYNLNYIKVLKFEADARTLSCYYETAIQSTYMNLQWISSFIN